MSIVKETIKHTRNTFHSIFPRVRKCVHGSSSSTPSIKKRKMKEGRSVVYVRGWTLHFLAFERDNVIHHSIHHGFPVATPIVFLALSFFSSCLCVLYRTGRYHCTHILTSADVSLCTCYLMSCTYHQFFTSPRVNPDSPLLIVIVFLYKLLGKFAIVMDEERCCFIFLADKKAHRSSFFLNVFLALLARWE